MLRVRALCIPDVLPHPDAIRSWGDNRHSYEPEFWEFQYEIYRYLGRVSDDELIERYRSLLRNMKSLVGPDRHLIPIQSFLSSWYWYRKEHQTRLEFAMRDKPLPVSPPDGSFDATPVDAPARPRSPNAGDVLFRYGKRTYMEAMVLQGHARIGPASFYQSLELGAARADEERAKHSFMPGQYTKVTTQDGRPIPVIGDIRQTVSAPNYYALSLSCDWDLSLYSAFDADACVVIRKPEELAHRLEVAAKEQLENWYFHHNPIEYFDPYEMAKNHYFDAAMCKDFRFAYQREYRFIWMNLEGQEASGFRHLNLGPLDNIAEVHVR
jgi:hypothetical protein